jgi:hypothetical protein
MITEAADRMTEIPPSSKTCRRCGQEKPVSDFSRHPRTSDGLKTLCRDCQAAVFREAPRPRPSHVELYSVIDALLPFAQVEIDFLTDTVQAFPDDLEHAEDAERARQGQEAIAEAQRLIGNKSYYIRRRQRELSGKADQVPAAPGAASPVPDDQPEENVSAPGCPIE